MSEQLSEYPSTTTLPPDLYSRNTIIAYLARKLAKWPILRILDVGGYNGKLSCFFPQETRFSILDRKPKPADELATYIQGDGRKMPFSDNNFDVVIASDLLEHVPVGERAQIITEMLRVSKNYLIIGFPFKNSLTEKAEQHITDQFLHYAGIAHPFLSEHKELGLPEVTEFEQILQEKNLHFFQLQEGNLMNWYIQQLYSTTQHGEKISEKQLNFQRFFNEHLEELGNLRAPAYRVIYCISKNAPLPEEEIKQELQQKYLWKAEVFMDLLSVAFDDLRSVIEQRKEQINTLQKTNNQHENTLGIARKSVQAHKLAINELRNFLIEKEQTINFLKGIIQQKDLQFFELKESKNVLEQEFNQQYSFLKKLVTEIENKNAETTFLQNHIQKIEASLKLESQNLKSKEYELQAIRMDLTSHKNSLQQVMSSRAWRVIMFYSKIKINGFIKPLALIKKGWGILITYGPKIFWQRMLRKFKKAPQFPGEISAYDRYIEATTLHAKDLYIDQL